ncbi:hypothetical protein PR202_ga06212 [Eleusine coracana subsp. coracana]|uniref:Uncharacterized protein n=1 Tax=Eleusine coracana subsp. coracana TaxID=191504 RepID=A0AAV5BWN0_ELECO|nr:hypothetical protein QOZ80_2AG0098880 [Eleusine coracana subsp. coracana]GJM89978.1 hypothetical protein PR202_ga06212 [Eleusine coracana subsp. coracana]
MAAAEQGQGPPSGTTGGGGFFGMLSFRRSATAVASFDPAQDDELLALDGLQSHVADRLAALLLHAQAAQGPVLSLGFLSKLLDAVASSSDACFRDILSLAPVAAALSRPPADRLAADLLDRAVKTLDVLNSASLTLASLRGAHRAALAAASCLLLPAAPCNSRAQFARARRAIARIIATADDNSSSSNKSSSHSQGGGGNSTMRALSLSVSRNWSAGRSMNAMAAHLAPPPPPPMQQQAAAGAGCGLGLALYTMSSVLVFAMWALVAALPCQDRAFSPPVAPPKQAQWAGSMAALQDRIADEWKRRDKSRYHGSSSSSSSAINTAGAGGLLAEMQAVERAARDLNSLLEEIAESEEEDRSRDEILRERAEELAAACRALEEGLAPLERQLRAVFHRVVAFRADLVRSIDNSARTNATAPTQYHSF